jgi:TolB-like protein
MTRAFLALALLSTVAAAAEPTVAVMPFKDLSGGKGNVGEAIRETVTSDLKDVSGLRVIERGRIDQILAEQNLQANKADLDATSTVKVGKLLGASLIVTGAYQRAASQVRLTARFVKVETGEIVGTAKVDGSSGDFLHLQDKITASLLKSAGMAQKQVERFATRKRPKLKSFRPIELYGDAVVETDDSKKKQLLVAALNEDPSFVYATRDLDALEQRLKQYDAAAKAEQDRAIRELQQTIGSEKDPMQSFMKISQLFGTLSMQRRWRTIKIMARQIAKNPPPSPKTIPYSTAEFAEYNLLVAEQSMREDDALLHDGEKFLAQHPASSFAPSVRMWLEQAIDHKRRVFDGQQEVAEELDKQSAHERADPCRVATVYRDTEQLREARRLFEVCLARGHSFWAPADIDFALAQISAQMNDYGAARRYMTQMEKADPKKFRDFKGVMMGWPTD